MSHFRYERRSSMEKNIQSFTESLDHTFRLSDKDWSLYSPLTLAYIGDGAYDLVVRSLFVKTANCQTQKLHQKVTSCVSARAQAAMIEALRPCLTDEEAAIYRRGRNAKPYTKAKNASMQEYLEATGFEAMIGYLYLNGAFDRMNELIAKGLAAIGVWTQEEKERDEKREKN